MVLTMRKHLVGTDQNATIKMILDIVHDILIRLNNDRGLMWTTILRKHHIVLVPLVIRQTIVLTAHQIRTLMYNDINLEKSIIIKK